MRMVWVLMLTLVGSVQQGYADQRIDPLLEAQAISRAKYAKARELDEQATKIERSLSPGAVSYEAIGLRTQAKDLRREADAAIRTAQLSAKSSQRPPAPSRYFAPAPAPRIYYGSPRIYVGPRGHGSIRVGGFRFSF